MVDDAEINKPVDDVQQAKQEAKEEIDKTKVAGGPLEISSAQKELAQKYLNDLASKSTAAKEVINIDKATGHIEFKRKEAAEVKKTLVKVLEAIKAGIITPRNSTSKTILTELAERGGLTDTTGSYLQPLIEKYILKDITFSKEGQELSDFEKDFLKLKKDNPNAAESLGQIIYDKLEEVSTVSKDDLKKRLDLNINDEGKVGMAQDGEEAEPSSIEIDQFIEKLRQQEFDLYLTRKDKDFLKAIYFPNEFVKLIEKKKEEAKREGKAGNDEEAYEVASIALEHNLIEVIDKILTRFSETNPEKFFEQVAQENFMRGIQTTLATLGSYLDRLKTSLEEYEKSNQNVPHLYRSVGLDPIREDILIPYTDEKGKVVWVDKPRTRYKPLSKPEQVSLSGFASYMRLMMDERVGQREYLHNSRSIFLHPGDHEQGFYASLANYAEKMKTPALEEMFLFPDADIFQDAINLYDKFVDEQFASQDWQNTSDMFLNKTGTVMTRLEEEVLKALKQMHPDMEDSRLKTALFMAVGASRGIFMTEPEKSAYAEPRLTPDGKPTFTSYYTNDTDPLTPLNPMHFFWRWQAERSIPLWLFLPVEGFNPLEGTGTPGMWDHRQLWDNLKKYKDSYIKGRHNKIKNPLLMDFMLDISNVGGPSKRRGWRIYYSTEGHFIPRENESGKITNKFDVLKTWQAIENIGYELCYDFVFIQRAGADFLKVSERSLTTTEKKINDEKNPIKKQTLEETLKEEKYLLAEKKKFFEYLYKEYFISDPARFNESDLSAFLTGLNSKATEAAKLKLKRNLITPEELNDQIENEKSNLFLSETLARLVAKRFPSKILRVDKDRYNEDGKSRWRKVREKMKLSSVEFDKVMKNLCLAEAGLRKRVSEDMKKNIKEYASRTGKSLEDKDVGFHLPEVREGLDFRLTEDKIRDYLSQHKTDANDINQVVELYKILQQDYIGENASSQNFMKSFALYLNPTFTEEGSYTFTFGLDDTDMSLVAFRGAGGRLLARALKDTAQSEKNVTNEIMHLEEKLHAAAIDGKHDFSEIIGTIKKIRDTLVDIHGPDYAQKVSHHLSMAVINFFKKDTLSRSWATSWLVTDRPHSLAAEIYGGAMANVWEWNVSTIDQFIFQLRRARVLPQMPYDPSMGAPYELKDTKIKLFGKEINVGKHKEYRKPDTAWYEGSLRRDAGAATQHKLWEIANSVLPLLAIWLLWQYISKAFKEFGGEKQRAPA